MCHGGNHCNDMYIGLPFPCLYQTLHNLEGQSPLLWPLCPQIVQTSALGQSFAKWPACRHRLQRTGLQHSEAICPDSPQRKQILGSGQFRAKCPSLWQFKLCNIQKWKNTKINVLQNTLQLFYFQDYRGKLANGTVS